MSDKPRGTISEFPDFLTKLLAARFAEEGDSVPPKRAPLAEQAATLERLHVSEQVKHRFTSGDLVRIKDGFGSFKDALRPGTVFMYWRALMLDDYQDRLAIKFCQKQTSHQTRLNCVVAIISEDGHSVLRMLMNSVELEPWTLPGG